MAERNTTLLSGYRAEQPLKVPPVEAPHMIQSEHKKLITSSIHKLVFPPFTSPSDFGFLFLVVAISRLPFAPPARSSDPPAVSVAMQLARAPPVSSLPCTSRCFPFLPPCVVLLLWLAQCVTCFLYLLRCAFIPRHPWLGTTLGVSMPHI